MKILTKLALSLILSSSLANACGEVFVNKGGYHVTSRSMEFGRNMAFDTLVRYVGQKQTSNIIINLDKIPSSEIASWKYEYGFVGRGDRFRGGVLVDGLNEKGVSIAALYLAGVTQYPTYDKNNKRDVISIYDVGTYILSKAKSTDDAVKKLKNLQVVGGAIEASPGLFVKNLPLHFSIRDKSGKSVIVEWIDGKTIINENAGNVMTNAFKYDEQLKYAKKYSSLKMTNTKQNPEFKNRVIEYEKIYTMQGARPTQTALLGIPGDFTPPSRFVKATVLLDNMVVPKSSTQARLLATEILGSIATIGVSYDDLNLWYVVKDLDNLVFYSKDLYYYQTDNSVYAFDPAAGYDKIELKNIDFKTLPLGNEKMFQALSPSEAKKLKVYDISELE